MQDLTPHLRTRLSRVERAVGWFVLGATLLLLAGFSYYIYHTAQRKGWFVLKLPYHTFVQSASGLKVADKVKLMGFDVGEITRITAMPPFSDYGNVYIEFVVRAPYQGYIWDDSSVRVTTGDLLGNRYLELVQGGTSGRTNLHSSYRIENGVVTGVFNDKEGRYMPYTNGSPGYTLLANDPPALSERAEALVDQAQKALPNILQLTNQLANVLINLNNLVTNTTAIVGNAQPTVSNLAVITEFLKNPEGSLGHWLFPTNLNSQVEKTLVQANDTLDAATQTLESAETNLFVLTSNINLTLVNLAQITSNLNTQVQQNTNLVTVLSDAIRRSDELMQGLKKHWLLRSAFKSKPTNAPPARRSSKGR